MIEIIPNWHPIVVHFTIALLSMSVLFYLIQALLPENHHWQPSLSTLAKANLWIGTAFAIITAIAGWFAYNSVAHDTPSHTAMTEHRNIALVTLATFSILALWSVVIRKQKKAPIFFVIAMLIAGGLLATTGWKGAEAVYRYGLGVMSMPKSSGEGHAHKHAEGEGHGDSATPASQEQSSSSNQQVSSENMPHQHAEGTGHGDTAQTPTGVQASDAQAATPSATAENMPHEHAAGNAHGDTTTNIQTTPEQAQHSHDSTSHTH